MATKKAPVKKSTKAAMPMKGKMPMKKEKC